MNKNIGLDFFNYLLYDLPKPAEPRYKIAVEPKPPAPIIKTEEFNKFN